MKTNFFSLATIVALFVSFTLVSCDKKEDPKTGIDALLSEGVIYGELDHEVTLDAAKTYSLTGTLVIKDKGVLNIPAGTIIEAQEGFGSYIIVAQGGKLNVNGTAEKPVIMTAKDETAAKSGYWGGIVINGRAPISGAAAGGTGTCEINSKFTYGGTDAADNSGSITYLIVKYAGARSSADVEHNGLTLDAVGNGTTIQNVYVYKSADDGIECFGGSVNLKNILVVSQDDDMFDCTQGYKGNWENMYGVWESGFKSTEEDPRGIEADGNLDGKTPDDVNQSDFKVTNITFDLKLAYDTAAEENGTMMHDVIKVRRGAKTNISNALVKGTGTVEDIVDCTDKKGDCVTGTTINITNSLTNAKLGSDSKPGKNNATVTVGGANTGCDKGLFAWTKYAL